MLPRLQEWCGRHKVLCWAVAGLILFYTLAGFVIAPLVIDYTLRNKVSQSLNRKVEVDSVRLNPYTFSVRLIGLSLSGPGGDKFVEVGDFYTNADPLFSLFKWGVVVKSVEIKNPKVRIVRTSANQFNFSDLIPSNGKQEGEPEAEPSKPLRLVLNSFKLIDGQIQYTDKALDRPFESTLSELYITLDQLDTKPESEAAIYRLSARTEADEKFTVKGLADVDPLTVKASAQLDGLAISKYAPYYHTQLDGDITGGMVGFQAKLLWSNEVQRIEDIALTLSTLSLDSSNKEPLLAIPLFKVESAAVDLNKQEVQLGRVTTKDGRIHLKFNESGQLNLQAAFMPPPAKQPPLVEQKPKDGSQDTPPWVVDIPEFALENYTVRHQDQQTDPMADITIGQINLNARSMSTRKDARGKLDLTLKWSDQGMVSLGGETTLIPLQADMKVKAEGIDVRPLQPYINEHLQLVVTKGLFDTEGRLKLVPLDTDDLDIQYAGRMAVNQFKSVDKQNATEFLKWKSLYLTGIDLGTAPFRLTVNELSLTDFYNRLVISPDGTSNLASILGGTDKETKQQSKESTTTSEKKQPENATGQPDIRINTVTLQGGNVDFSDLFVKPNVRLPMEQIGGRISGLDAIKTHKANVLLKGSVGGNVPVEIKGKINPLIEMPFVDLTIALQGVDLSPFTPYSGKYLGYKLDKGQLSLDLAYRVADNKLAAQNKVLLSQITLGETVASPTATKLPIKLALALLKDRKGNIDLDLPISGDLNDPEFSIGGIVVKMLVNLVVGIVSSPFKMLGTLFGGGEELAYLDFEPGQSLIAENSKGKLETLAKILYERPGLNLEIQGQVHPKEDIDGLRRVRFDEQLKSAKLKSMVAWGKKAVPLEQIQLTLEERHKLIKKAYGKATFPKPRDEKGKLKKLDPEEMEKLLFTAIEISDDDLRLLAHRRASAAKEYLANQGKVEVKRLFIIEPSIGKNEPEEDRLSRVKFNLT